MGRSPCCDKIGLKKGPWTPEEDQKLLAYIEEHALPWMLAHLARQSWAGEMWESCRLRWNNYLRPDINRGKFSLQEEQTIIQLHALLGNRWSHKPQHDHALSLNNSFGQSKNAANQSHMAQSARSRSQISQTIKTSS